MFTAIVNYVNARCDLAVIQATAPNDKPRVDRALALVRKTELELAQSIAERDNDTASGQLDHLRHFHGIG